MTYFDLGQNWFLAQLRPNCSNLAERNLKRQGFEVFFPVESVTVRRKGQFVDVHKPLFPGYMFVSSGEFWSQWHKINSTYGVARLVSFGSGPAQVPSELVANLQQRCDASGVLLPPKLLEPGDRVRITAGPFADFAAEVESIAIGRRVWVLLELMGCHTRVALKEEHLRTLELR